MPKAASSSSGVFARNAKAQEDRPPRTAATVVYTLGVFLLLALVFAGLTPVKELTRASGTLQPLGGPRQLEHLTGGIVTAVHVEEGELVRTGEVIAELSSPPISADLIRTQAESDQAKARLSDLSWLLQHLSEGRLQTADPGPEATDNQTRKYAQARLSLHQAALEIIDHAARASEAEQRALQEADKAAWDRVALVEQRLDRLSQLSQGGYVSEFRLMDEQERLEELRAEAVAASLSVEKAKSQQATDQARSMEEALRFREAVLKEAYNSELEVRRLAADLEHLQSQIDSLVIRAPAPGVIQSITFPSVGEVVAPGDPLFDLLPTDEPLMAEIKLQLADIGHVQLGDRARLKISSFDFRKFGGIEGQIVSLSPDIVEDPDGTQFFRAILALDRETIGSGTLERDLHPGMQVSAEIQTGSRTVLAYLLKPIESSLIVALSER